jgi:hypothetical protein
LGSAGACLSSEPGSLRDRLVGSAEVAKHQPGGSGILWPMPAGHGGPPASGRRRGVARPAVCRHPTVPRSRCLDKTRRVQRRSAPCRPGRPQPRRCWAALRARSAASYPKAEWSPPNTWSCTDTSSSTPPPSLTGTSFTPGDDGASSARSAIAAISSVSVGPAVKPARWDSFQLPAGAGSEGFGCWLVRASGSLWTRRPCFGPVACVCAPMFADPCGRGPGLRLLARI